AISEKRKIVRSNSYEPHTLGTKYFARLADEEKKKTGILSTRGTLYIMSRTKKNGGIVNATAAKLIKELLNDVGTSTSNTTNDASTSTNNTTTGNGIVDWSNDDLARVKGKEKEDYTRCVGPNIRLPRQEMKENQAAILQFMAKYKNHNSNEDFSNVLNTRNTEVANDSSSVHNPGPYGNSTSTRASENIICVIGADIEALSREMVVQCLGEFGIQFKGIRLPCQRVELARQREEDTGAAKAVAEMQKMIESEKETIEKKPFMDLQRETKKIRQDIFKKRHRAKALEGQCQTLALF
ncbi:transposase, Ptta/En/Spm, partial [Tanacetum coccineum]